MTVSRGPRYWEAEVMNMHDNTRAGDAVHFFSPLHHAAFVGDLEAVRKLCETDRELIETRDMDECLPIHAAAANGHLDVLRHLIEVGGANESEVDENGDQILIIAARHGHVDVLRYLLLDLEVSFVARNMLGDNALCCAASHGCYQCVLELLKRGCPVNLPGSNNTTAMHFAARAGELEVLRLLVKWGGDIAAEDKAGFTVLHYAVIGGSLPCVKFLREEAESWVCFPVERPLEQWKCLTVALAFCLGNNICELERGDAEYLKEEGGDKRIDEWGVDGELLERRCLGRVVVIRMKVYILLSKRWMGQKKINALKREYYNAKVRLCNNLNSPDEMGLSSHQLEAEDVYWERFQEMEASITISTELCRNGAWKLFWDSNGHHMCSQSSLGQEQIEGGEPLCMKTKEVTPFNKDEFAFFTNHICTMDKVLVNEVHSLRSQSSVLHLAVQKEFLHIVTYLLENGAYPNSQTDNMETPLHCAITQCSRECVKTLLRFGADVDKSMRIGGTPLHQAVMTRFPQIVLELLQAGANLNAQNSKGDTPLHWAARSHNPTLCRLLIDWGANMFATNEQGDQAKECTKYKPCFVETRKAEALKSNTIGRLAFHLNALGNVNTCSTVPIHSHKEPVAPFYFLEYGGLHIYYTQCPASLVNDKSAFCGYELNEEYSFYIPKELGVDTHQEPPIVQSDTTSRRRKVTEFELWNDRIKSAFETFVVLNEAERQRGFPCSLKALVRRNMYSDSNMMIDSPPEGNIHRVLNSLPSELQEYVRGPSFGS
eukprot:Nk52_evm33s224 gene=Nk52_evmTU33s224